MLETDRDAINQDQVDFSVWNTDGLDRVFDRRCAPNPVANILLAYAGR